MKRSRPSVGERPTSVNNPRPTFCWSEGSKRKEEYQHIGMKEGMQQRLFLLYNFQNNPAANYVNKILA